MTAIPLLGRFLLYGFVASVSSKSWTTGLVLGTVAGAIGLGLEWRLRTWFETSTSFLAVLGFLWSLSIGGGDAVDLRSLVFLGGSVLLFVILSATTLPPLASTVVAVGAILAPAAYAGFHAAWRDIGGPHILSGLFGSRGVLYQSSLLWLGIIGLPGARRVKSSTAVVWIGAVLAGLLSLALDTENPETPARTALWLPFLLPGIASMFDRLQASVAQRPERFVMGAASLLVLWNLLFMEQYRQVRVPIDDTVSFADVTSNSAELLSRAVGTPFAWPANWIFARRFHVRPDRWDAVAGRHLFADARASTTTIEFGNEDSIFATDVALIANGFRTRRTCGQSWCRDIDGAARILLPIQNPGTGDFTITVRARGEGTLSMSFDKAGTSVTELSSTLEDLTLRIPARLVDADVHVVSFAVAEGGRATLQSLTLIRDLGNALAR